MVNLASVLIAATIASLSQPSEPSETSPTPTIGYDVFHEGAWQRSVAFINLGLVGSDGSSASYDWVVELRRADAEQERFEMRECPNLADSLARVVQADPGSFHVPGVTPYHGRIGARKDGFHYGIWGSTRDEQGFGGQIAIWPTGEMAAALGDLDRRVQECAAER